MVLTARRTWLIAYDIREPRRLRRVHAYLREQAVPVQYSVFVTRCTSKQVADIRARLSEIIDHKADDVRIYQVPDQAQIVVLGVKALSDGIQLLEGASSVGLDSFTSGDQPTKVVGVVEV